MGTAISGAEGLSQGARQLSSSSAQLCREPRSLSLGKTSTLSAQAHDGGSAKYHEPRARESVGEHWIRPLEERQNVFLFVAL